MATQWNPIFGSGLDQIADQRYRWAGVDNSNREGNIARANQAQQYWDSGVAQNAAAQREAQEQAMRMEIALANRAQELQRAQQQEARRQYEFGVDLDYRRGRDRTTDAFRRSELAATVSGRAAALAHKNAELQAALKAEAADQAAALEQSAAEARRLNQFLTQKRIEKTFTEKFKDVIGTPNEARTRRSVAEMPPESLSKLDGESLKKAIEEFKLTSGLEGFEFDQGTQMLVPAAKGGYFNSPQTGFRPVMGDVRRADEAGMSNYFSPPTQTATTPAPVRFTSPVEVKAAYRSGKLSKEQAAQILQSQFGLE